MIQRVLGVGQRPDVSVLAVDPQPRLIGVHHAGHAQRQLQAVILSFQPVAHPPQLLADGRGGHLQSQLLEERGDLPQRQAIAHPHHRRPGQGVDSQLRVRQVGGRRLLGGPRFDVLAARWAPAADGVVAGGLHFDGNDLFHHAVMMFHFAQLRLAVRAGDLATLIVGQRHLLVHVDFRRRRSHGPLSVPAFSDASSAPPPA